MHIKRFRYFFMLLIFLLCAGSGYLLSKHHLSDSDTFFCTSDFTLHSGNEKLSLSVNFNLNHGDGFASMNGIFYREGVKQSTINLEKEFIYTQDEGEFIFRQKQNGVQELNNSDPDVLKKYLPDFYFNKNTGPHHVRIKTIRPGVWIITTTPIPYLICSEY